MRHTRPNPDRWNRGGTDLTAIAGPFVILGLLSQAPGPFLDAPGNAATPRVSPDGRWVAYQSDARGNTDLRVAALDPETGEPGASTLLLDWTASESRPSWSPDSSELVFASDRGGSWDLWIVGRDGRGPRRLTETPGTASAPQWSRNDEIVFHADTAGSWDLWSVPAGGGEPRQLTDHAGNEYHPRWSPDGSHIVFYTTWSGWTDLWVYDLSAARSRPLLVSENEDYFPVWSGDGRHVIFQSDRAGDPERVDIWAIPAVGGAPRSVLRIDDEVRFLDDPWHPSLLAELRVREWSLFTVPATGGAATPIVVGDHRANDPGDLPGETPRVLYSTDQGESERHIFVAGTGGPSRRRLTSGRRNHERPRVSPDGREVAYVAGGGDYASYDLFVQPLTGGTPRRLTELGNVRHPAWCDGGAGLVFSRGAVAYAGDRQLWHVDVGSGRSRQISDTPVVDSPSDCTPSGTTILYSALGDPARRIDADSRDDARADRASLDIFAVDYRTGSTRRLTTAAGDDVDASWSPDGQRVVFASNRSGSYEIWMMAASGGPPQQLTETAGEARRPRFTDDGATIVFQAGRRTTRLARLDRDALQQALRSLDRTDARLP